MDAVRNLTLINLATSGAVRYSLKRWPTHLASGIGHSLAHEQASASNRSSC